MIAEGPARREAFASTSRLRSSTSGTPSKMMAASFIAAAASISGNSRGGDQERQAKAQILPHIAMLRQHDALAPIAGVGQAVMRATAIHPFLALLCIVMRQWKMRRSVAESFAYRDAFGVERVGD